MRSTQFITQLQASLFPANVYGNKAAVRHPNNVIQRPDGWDTVEDPLFFAINNSSGFMAWAYFKTGDLSQIVICFAGTTNEIGSESLDWLNGNSAGLGVLSPQVVEAAAFYTRLRAAYPNAQFTQSNHTNIQ
jgi:hypothetical protein